MAAASSTDVVRKAVRALALSQTRLRSNTDFQRIYKKAKRFTGPFLLLLAQPNNLEYPRLGLSLAKKKVKTAVARNRIKRIVRESFRAHLTNLPGVDIIVIASQGCDQIPNEKLFETLQKRWPELIAYYKKSSPV